MALPTALRTAGRAVVPVLVAGAAVLSVRATSSLPEFSLARQAPGGLPLLLLAGGALLAAGEAAARQPSGRRTAWLCRLAALAWLVAEWDDPGAPSAVVFTVGLLLGAAGPAVVAHLAVDRSGGSRRLRRALVVAGYVVTVGVQGIAATVLADPVSAGCLGCPHVLVPSVADAALASAVRQAGLVAGVAWGAAVVLLLAGDVTRAGRGPGDAAVRTAALVYLAAVTAAAAHDLRLGFPGTDALDAAAWTVQGLALVALAAAVAAGLARARSARRALARVVLDLGAGSRPGGLRQALAERFADPDLVLAYRVDGGRLVDRGGREVPAPPADGRRARSEIELGGEAVVVLGHRRDVLTSPAERAALAATVGLALDNERLQAELLVQLADLERSGARIVAAGDDERRRLEQDLHDGAQQRLVALALELQLFRGLHPGGEEPELARAEDELRAAVAELRALARGVYPALLRTGGLPAALEGLAESRPLRWAGLPDERLPEVVESTVYLLAERLSAGGWTTLELQTCDRLLTVRAHVAGRPVQLDDLTARVATLDGSVTVTPDGEGVRVEVRLPVPATPVRELT